MTWFPFLGELILSCLFSASWISDSVNAQSTSCSGHPVFGRLPLQMTLLVQVLTPSLWQYREIICSKSTQEGVFLLALCSPTSSNRNRGGGIIMHMNMLFVYAALHIPHWFRNWVHFCVHTHTHTHTHTHKHTFNEFPTSANKRSVCEWWLGMERCSWSAWT